MICPTLVDKSVQSTVQTVQIRQRSLFFASIEFRVEEVIRIHHHHLLSALEPVLLCNVHSYAIYVLMVTDPSPAQPGIHFHSC